LLPLMMANTVTANKKMAMNNMILLVHLTLFHLAGLFV